MKVKVNRVNLRIKDCCSPLRAMKGLMFSSLKNIDGALIKGNSIWLLFCKPLTLIFLDKSFQILDQQEAIPMTLNPKTWKLYTCKQAKYCLEIKSGLFKQRIKSVEVEV